MIEQPYSPTEMMIVAAARELAGQRVCFVGIGLPNIVVNLALHTVAPHLELIYEAGAYGAQPARLPLSIGDPTIVTGATAVMSMAELFGFYLQRGLVDVGFLGAAQIDRFGNINTTVIGDYRAPRIRLPGSGGACEIAINARKVFVVMRQSKRSFVERIDFCTSPGNAARTDEPRTGESRAHELRAGKPDASEQASRGASSRSGRGPSVVVSDMAVYHFDDDGQMRLDTLHPGVSLDSVRSTMGWDVRVAADAAATPAPSPDELRLIREVLDPDGHYTR